MSGSPFTRGPCPRCGREVALNKNGIPAGHYSPSNPPVIGAWAGCPGPTPGQLERAACYRQAVAVAREKCIQERGGRW